MDKRKQTVRIAYWCFLVVGSLAVGMGTAKLGLSDFAKNTILVAWVVAVVALMVLIDVLWIRKLNRRIQDLNKILTEERDPDRYIVELNALLDGKRSLQLRQLRLLNLGAAYCDKREYQTAKDYFLQIQPAKLYGMQKWIYWMNLALVQFYLGENIDACSILIKQGDSFACLKKSGQFGDLLAILSTFQLLAGGNYAKAKQYLEQQQPIWETPRNADDFAYLRALLASNEKQCML